MSTLENRCGHKINDLPWGCCALPEGHLALAHPKHNPRHQNGIHTWHATARPRKKPYIFAGGVRIPPQLHQALREAFPRLEKRDQAGLVRLLLWRYLQREKPQIFDEHWVPERKKKS